VDSLPGLSSLWLQLASAKGRKEEKKEGRRRQRKIS
jgi:hypothetical protein